MTSSQATPCGYGSRIALRLCGTTAVDLVCRHCERSEAIHGIRKKAGLLRCARNDGEWSVVFAPVRRRGALAIGVVPRTQGPIRRVASVERRCSMTSSQTTPCGHGSRIALRLCGTTAVDLVCRHCERSEAIHGASARKMDCFAALAMTANGPSRSLLCADVVRWPSVSSLRKQGPI